MPNRVVKFEPGLAGAPRTPSIATVYVRTAWADDWELLPELHPLELTWSVAPSIPTATFVWLYGKVLQFGDATLETVLKRADSRIFVRVDVTTQGAARQWFGVIEITEDQLGGVDSVATGEQTLTAYGMEKLLADHLVDSTVWWDDSDLQSNTADFPHVFNPGGLGNRTAAKHNGSYLFAEVEQLAGQPWATQEIVEYLLVNQTPQDEAGNVDVTFAFDQAAPIPTWDRPEFDPQQSTTYSILDRLVNRRRLFVWWLEYEAGPNHMIFRAATLAAADITLDMLDASPTVTANAETRELEFDSDPGTNVTLKKSDAERCDQVVARGARRLSVASFTNATARSPDQSKLATAWESTDETEYEAGASGATDYANLSVSDKTKRNTAVRSSPHLNEVFAVFKIADDFNGEVPDELGVHHAVFDDGSGNYYPAYASQSFILPSLPLVAGIDYSGTAVDTGITEPEGAEPLPPLVFLQRPEDTTKWVLGNTLGVASEVEPIDDDEQNDFSLAVSVIPNSRKVRLDVLGAPQHAIASVWFTPLADDRDFGQYDANNMLVTVCLQDSRYTQGVWPDPPSTAQAVRRKYLWLGDSYRKIYVVPGTAVGIDEDGALLVSEGGYIPTDTAEDDEDKLQAIAKLAAEWYTRTRKVVSLQSNQMKPAIDLGLGNLVTTTAPAGSAQRETVNSIITEMSVTLPQFEPQSPEFPEFRMQTWAGELDPMQLLPQPGGLA